MWHRFFGMGSIWGPGSITTSMTSVSFSRAHVARQVMERVIELDHAYHHGGAHLFLMAFYGSRSPMMGGDQKRADYHYQQLKKIAGDDYLLADLIYARFLPLPTTGSPGVCGDNETHHEPPIHCERCGLVQCHCRPTSRHLSGCGEFPF